VRLTFSWRSTRREAKHQEWAGTRSTGVDRTARVCAGCRGCSPKWVLDHVLLADGTIERFKARLVLQAQGSCRYVRHAARIRTVDFNALHRRHAAWCC
jgi:hypothetical protein